MNIAKPSLEPHRTAALSPRICITQTMNCVIQTLTRKKDSHSAAMVNPG